MNIVLIQLPDGSFGGVTINLESPVQASAIDAFETLVGISLTDTCFVVAVETL